MGSGITVQKDPPRTFKCSPGCIHPVCIKLPEKSAVESKPAVCGAGVLDYPWWVCELKHGHEGPHRWGGHAWYA